LTEQATLKVAVLISGEGTNLQALIDAAGLPAAEFAISAVFSDRADARGLARARAAGIPAIVLDPRAYPERESFDAALAAAINQFDPGIVVLAGFMRILSAAFVAAFSGRILNIHPSLLPKFKGLHTHRRALEARESEHGATVHFVTAALDSGPALIQYRLKVRDDDTEASLSARVHTGEYIILPEAVAWFAAGRLSLEGSTVKLDGNVLREPVCINDAT
jgi:phosphoribosylglycinamide formyltransferase-1